MKNTRYETIADILAEMRDFANRQEKNNCYDLREMGTDSLRAYADRIESEVKRKELRNCDVGTAEEQAERFYLFCKTHQSGIQGMCSPLCQCKECSDMCHCLTKWSQMTYEEGEAK